MKLSGPLRVVHVVYPSFGYTFSGTTKHILRLLREWQVQDIQLTVWGSDYLERCTDSDDPPFWNGVLRHTRSVRLRWAFQLLWMLIRRRQHYDLIHVHVLWWGGLLAPLVARLLGKKAIYHMTLLGSDTPGSLVSQSLGSLKLALFKQYHGAVGLTPALVDDCRRHGLESEFLVLPGFLVFDPPSLPDLARRQHVRQQWGIPGHAQVLLFVGSIIRRKGVDLLVDLFTQLASKQPDLWLMLVGAYTRAENPRLDEEFVASQQDKLVRAGLNGRVIWTGLVRDEDKLVDAYLASDAFIFPTRAEGQGYVILEAMGCGLPVVCSYLPGVTDVMVVHNKTGYLVKPDDLEGFVTATTKLLDDPELRERMGMAGYKRAISEFGFDAYCRRLADFYRTVAAGGQVNSKPDLTDALVQERESNSGYAHWERET